MIENGRQIKIERPLYEQEQLHYELEYCKSKKPLIKKLLSNCEDNSPKKLLYKTIPALEWLSHYKWKEYLTADLISGFTVAIMHIPQGMAYGMLGNVPPITGIYMAFFPVLIYFLFGTSKHNSLGTFAVVCLMTGKVVLEHSHPSFFDGKRVNHTEILNSGETFYTPMDVATTVCFMVAIMQLVMFVCRLGIVSSLISDTLVSGFTTGAAIHVLTSQIKDLFGYTIPKHKGMFSVINTYVSIFKNITNVNYVAIAMSAVTITITVFNNEFLKPKVAKKSSFPIPIELLVIVSGTLCSYFLHLNDDFNITIVGDIPSGLPGPSIPSFSLMNSIFLDCFIIAIVSYTINLSMALIFAQKLGYEVDANQELLAMGAGNLVGSFFSCMPFTASLSRSLIQQTVGGKTQLASVVSCGILVFVLMWIGPYFEPLPRCVLASVIVVALKGMFLQIRDFWKFWKLSKLDAAIWMVTFVGVVFVSIDIGLLVGVIMSLVTIFLLGMKPYTCLLGSVPHTDLYVDIKRYKGAEEIPGLKIFHYQGGINFASRNYFKSELYSLINLDPQKELVWRKKLTKLADLETQTKSPSTIVKLKEKQDKLQNKSNTSIRCLILDFSALSYVDPAGVSMLKNIEHFFKQLDIPIYVTGCSAPVYEMMVKCELIDLKKYTFRIFPTIHDAVLYATSTLYLVEPILPPPIDC
ncbi:Sulfate permease family [Popillia japonica]|uniref:Sulfate permease family n=1 Tax=Popillia japonica TaxID=7064 RepID=A0AAW1NAZ9_POPJA